MALRTRARAGARTQANRTTSTEPKKATKAQLTRRSNKTQSTRGKKAKTQSTRVPKRESQRVSPKARRSRPQSTIRRPGSPPVIAGRAALARAAQKIGREAAAQMVPADAIALLEQDHREAEAFFTQFEEDEEGKGELARKICLALTVHATLEEAIFYPAAREAEASELLDEAEVEHAAAKQMITEIERMRTRDRLFNAKVKVLGEYVKHHIQEEENKLFPAVRETGLDTVSLGQQMAERRIALLIQLGPRK